MRQAAYSSTDLKRVAFESKVQDLQQCLGDYKPSTAKIQQTKWQIASEEFSVSR